MKFSTLILTTLTSMVVAAPAPDANAASDVDAAAAATKFFLVIRSTDDRINGQCAGGYHTGAGTSDAIIQKCGPAPPKEFTYNASTGKINFLGYGNDTKSAIYADPGVDHYNQWGPITVDAGNPGSQFTYDKTKGFLQKVNGFGHLACRWAHAGEWQLFAIGSKNPVSLANCAKVTVLKGCYNNDPGCKNNTF